MVDSSTVLISYFWFISGSPCCSVRILSVMFSEFLGFVFLFLFLHETCCMKHVLSVLSNKKEEDDHERHSGHDDKPLSLKQQCRFTTTHLAGFLNTHCVFLEELYCFSAMCSSSFVCSLVFWKSSIKQDL
ncbi:hypothetical protein DPEC_G00029820 [Dallia pectoralis]|uniref:Uncharacterized protein n=1 Tax=Dallia pectoralis TaxID=75939 RepID=A0ACC2HJ81_DALPE|nr:hypothetical protein DPEC_G00029820 [Dallia pectoralis]